MSDNLPNSVRLITRVFFGLALLLLGFSSAHAVAPIKLNGNLVAGSNVDSFYQSKRGDYIAYLANQSLANLVGLGLYSYSVDNSATKKLNPQLNSNQHIGRVLNAGEGLVFYICSADISSFYNECDNELPAKLYYASYDGLVSRLLSSDLNVQNPNFQLTEDGNTVVFKELTTQGLFTLDLDNGSTPVRLNNRAPEVADALGISTTAVITSVKLTPDSKSLLVNADSSVYLVNLTSYSTTLILTTDNPPQTGSGYSSIISKSGSLIFLQQGLYGQCLLYTQTDQAITEVASCPTSNNNITEDELNYIGHTREVAGFSTPTNTTLYRYPIWNMDLITGDSKLVYSNVFGASYSPDEQHIVFVARLYICYNCGATDLRTIPVDADSDSEAIILASYPAVFAFVSGTDKLIFHDRRSIYQIPFDGSSVAKKISTFDTEDSAITSFKVSPNSDRVVYERRSLEYGNELSNAELFSAPSLGGLNKRTSHILGAGEQGYRAPTSNGFDLFRRNYEFDRDGESLIFTANFDNRETRELYLVTPLPDNPNKELCFPIPIKRNATATIVCL